MTKFSRPDRRMYIRMSGLSIVRIGGSASKTVFLIVLGLSAFMIFMLISLVSDQHPIVVPPVVFVRDAELTTWGMNQSVLVEDYLDLLDSSTYLVQPTDWDHGGNSTSNNYCGVNTKVLIMVTSAPSNYERRRAIRETWGSRFNTKGLGVKVVFVLGTGESSSTRVEVAQEAANHGDILQEDFVDSYHNLTLKSIAILKWVQLTCSLSVNETSNAPQFVLKTDDDIFVNINRLLKVAQTSNGANMIGRLTCGAKPIADVKSKLYMPSYLYPGRMYPGYLSGTGYLLRGGIIPILLQNAIKTPLVHLEDIYVTALLARQNHIYPEDSSYFTYARIDPKDLCSYKYMVNSHQIEPNEMRTVYANLKKPVKCVTKKIKHIRKVPRTLNHLLRRYCLFE